MFCKEKSIYRGSACFAWKHLVVLQNIHNNRIFLQNINISDRIRFKTAQYCRFVSKFCTGMSVHGDAEEEVVSHPFPPALPQCPPAASVRPFQVYKLYSRPPCIVLNLCFWFRPGLCHGIMSRCHRRPQRASRVTPTAPDPAVITTLLLGYAGVTG